MTTDVVRLVGHAGWNTTLSRGTDQEGAEVSDARLRCPAKQRSSDESESAVDQEQWPANAIAISKPCHGPHDNTSQYVGWCGEVLRFASPIAHVLHEDDGQEEADGIG